MSYFEFTIRIPAPFKDALIQQLIGAGCLGVVEHDNDRVTAYFPEAVDIKTIVHDLALVQALLEKSDPSEKFTFTHRIIPEQDWNETWKKDFHAIDVGVHFTVLPPWEKQRKGRINLVIDPAMAFGTGHHETTRSCLELMDKYTPQVRRDRFLDLGTGTGILAIAAAKLGYRRVTGVDTDKLAVEAARKNIELNQTGGIEIQKGSISDLDGTYDFITANIIASVLVELAPLMASHLKQDGIAVLSGLLTGQDKEVIEAMAQTGLNLVERYLGGKWVSLVVSCSTKN
jgi:ribosomal protein L11 methyltransferase